jgi:hypothetical protein
VVIADRVIADRAIADRAIADRAIADRAIVSPTIVTIDTRHLRVTVASRNRTFWGSLLF